MRHVRIGVERRRISGRDRAERLGRRLRRHEGTAEVLHRAVDPQLQRLGAHRFEIRDHIGPALPLIDQRLADRPERADRDAENDLIEVLPLLEAKRAQRRRLRTVIILKIDAVGSKLLAVQDLVPQRRVWPAVDSRHWRPERIVFRNARSKLRLLLDHDGFDRVPSALGNRAVTLWKKRNVTPRLFSNW